VRAARDPVDWSRLDPRVVQRVQGQNPPWVLESTARCSVKCIKGAAAQDGLTGGEVRLRLDNVPHGEVCGVLLVH
jgi:hypothetical protein